MDVSNATNLKPPQIMMVVAGGVVLGIGWRYWSNRRGGSTSTPVDPNDSLEYTMPSVGNLGENLDSADRRDITNGTINLPVNGWVVTIAGVKYWTDGTNLTPIGGTTTPPPDKPRDTNKTALSAEAIASSANPQNQQAYQYVLNNPPPPRAPAPARTQQQVAWDYLNARR